MKKYNIIYADPPWKFNNSVYQDNNRKNRYLNEQYKSMTLNELEQLNIKNISDDDCALFLWVTDMHLKQGLDLIEIWGFEYKTIVFIWEKITKNGKTCANLGGYTMKNCEICLLGIKGKMFNKKINKNIFQLIKAERLEHSRKPNEARKRILKLFGDLSRIELFARESKEGFDVWGNETNKFQ